MNRDELNTCYTRLFQTPDGKQVLKDLENQFKEKTDPNDMQIVYHRMGQRSVLNYVLTNIKRGENGGDSSK